MPIKEPWQTSPDAAQGSGCTPDIQDPPSGAPVDDPPLPLEVSPLVVLPLVVVPPPVVVEPAVVVPTPPPVEDEELAPVVLLLVEVLGPVLEPAAVPRGVCWLEQAPRSSEKMRSARKRGGGYPIPVGDVIPGPRMVTRASSR
jgi:hypothetical protein